MSYTDMAQQTDPIEALGKLVGNAEKQTTGFFSAFRNNKFVSGSTDFLNSNSIVAKVVFIIIIVILFFVLSRIMFNILYKIYSPSPNPYLIQGMKSGKKFIRKTQDPKQKDSTPILRSKNEDGGIEFTWNVWLFIESFEQDKQKKKHIFHKGSETFSGKSNRGDIAWPNNAPGLYLHENKNSLVVIMNTFDSMVEEIEIPNIPINKWINVSIRVKNKKLDVYVNDTIASRHILSNSPKQNYGDVFINYKGGFQGKLSNLRYYNSALTGIEITKIVRGGPNLKVSDDELYIFPPYFSMNWYFNTSET